MSWFPKYTPDGKHIVSGAGSLELDGRALGIAGWQPVPIDNTRIVFNGGPSVGLQQLRLDNGEVTTLDPRELIELAGGGGWWAGRHAPTDTLIFSDGTVLHGAGQPCIASDGEPIYRQGDDKIEPSICLTAEAWGNGRGRILARWRNSPQIVDVTVGNFEARAHLIDTHEGPWVFAMTREGLHLRPLFGAHGYRFVTGEDKNLHGHAVCVNGLIRCVWQDTQGNQQTRDVSMSETRISLVTQDPVVIPEPSTPTPEPEPAPVSIPKLFHVIEAVSAEHPHLIAQNTRETIRELYHRCVWALHQADPRFGFLSKESHENHQVIDGKLLAVDAVAYDGVKPIVDIFSSAGDGPGKGGLTWGEDPHRRESNKWVQPWPFAASEAPKDPPKQPEPQPVCNCAALKAEIDELREGLGALGGAFSGFMEETIEALLELENKPAPELKLPKLRAKSNGGWLGHSHDVEVVPE